MRNYQLDGEPIITRDHHVIKEGDWLSLAHSGCADDFIVKAIWPNGFTTARVIWNDDEFNTWGEESYTEFVPESESKNYIYE